MLYNVLVYLFLAVELFIPLTGHIFIEMINKIIVMDLLRFGLKFSSIQVTSHLIIHKCIN